VIDSSVGANVPQTIVIGQSPDEATFGRQVPRCCIALDGAGQMVSSTIIPADLAGRTGNGSLPAPKAASKAWLTCYDISFSGDGG
jgi:hypothetical protein